MARSSTIRRLEPEFQELIGRLRERGRTIDEILAHLAKLDVEVSRSALGRHIQTIDRIGERIRKQRAIAEAIVTRFGEDEENQLARGNIELLHAALMELTGGEDGQPVELTPKSAALLAQATKDLSTAKRNDAVVALKAREEMAKAAAQAVDRVAKTKGLSADQVAALKSEFLGIRK